MQWYKYTMDYHSALKGKEMLTLATTLMDLEGIMPSDKPVTKGQTLYESTHMRSLESNS